MAMSRGLTDVRRVSLGGEPVKQISLGDRLVWSDTKEFREDWNSIDTSLWRLEPTSTGNVQPLYTSGGLLRAGDTTAWNANYIMYVSTLEQYLSPAARWRMKLGGTPNGLITRLVLSTTSGNAGRMMCVDVVRSRVVLQWRTARSEPFQALATRSSTVPANAVIQVDRDEASNYQVRVDGSLVLEASDSARRAEGEDLGRVGIGIQSDQNVFTVKNWAAPVDWIDYTDDV